MITEYPLTKANRIQLARAFRNVPHVDITIECVVEGQMGRAYVDDVQNPLAYKIQLGPFFYFAGNASQEMLEDIRPWTLFMPSSPGWVDAARAMYREKLVSFDRYSFSSECLSVEHLQKFCDVTRFDKDVKRMDIPLVTRVWGQDHFIDVSNFESPADFIERGIGYYVEKGREIIGAAYSSLVCSKGTEVSIFVEEDYRRQGIATILAANLIKWCLESNMDPHWDAANLESCRLAEKLGYTPAGKYQAYYLKD
jgi:GNAT superfamily N-acetyltransferase